MSTAKHTPGPWSWGYNPHCRTDMPILSGATGEVCNFGNCERYYPTEGAPPSLADSRLIAAAPELLEALHAVLHHFDKASYDDAFALAAKAIAKATGEQP